MKFLFCSLSNYGFIYPAIGIAKTLRQKGHEVLFLTSSALGKIIKKAGFELVTCTEKDNPGFRVYNWGKPFAAAIQVKYIQYAIKNFAPDVIVGQHLTLGPLINRKLYDIPVAILGLAAYLYPACKSLLERSPQTESEERLVWRYGDMMRIYNESCELLGVPPSSANYRETPLLGDLYLLRSVPELEGNVDILPDRVHLVGDCLWEPPLLHTELNCWLQQFDISTKPLIYVQPGRTFEDPKFWSYLVNALKNRPVHVIASVGRMDGEIGEIPENFFVRKHIPQGLILPKAKAVISSGHSTAVLGAITHGLPSLIIAYGSGSEDIAERCLRAGAAIYLSPFEVTVKTIGKTVDQLLDCPNLQRNSQLLQQAFIKANKKNQAAELLQDLAFTRYSVLRA
ncbi:MAG: glycosyltransferase [Calothrix sp. MO_167.B12]|nr:glycosyltransferase [Calothrix sp. MO_167.B12]